MRKPRSPSGDGGWAHFRGCVGEEVARQCIEKWSAIRIHHLNELAMTKPLNLTGKYGHSSDDCEWSHRRIIKIRWGTFGVPINQIPNLESLFIHCGSP